MPPYMRPGRKLPEERWCVPSRKRSTNALACRETEPLAGKECTMLYDARHGHFDPSEPPSPEEEEVARAEGCFDAEERRMWMEETDKFIDSHEDMHNRARCAFLYDLESVGVAGMLGPVSRAAHMLPGEPKLGPPDEVHPPKDPMMRAAQVAGMRTYLVRIHQKLRETGAGPSEDPETGETYWPYNRDTAYYLEERNRIARRLKAFGEDIEAIEDSIKPGEEPSYEYWAPGEEEATSEESTEPERKTDDWESER